MELDNKVDIYNISKRIEILKRKLEVEELRLESLILEDQLSSVDGNEYLKTQLESIIKLKKSEILENTIDRESEMNGLDNQYKFPKLSYRMIHQFFGEVVYDVQMRDTNHIKWLKSRVESEDDIMRIKSEYDKIHGIVESELDEMLLNDSYKLFYSYKIED